jgi:hypothetical protein
VELSCPKKMDKKLEIKILELKVQFTRYHYFRARSELKMIQAAEEEDFETAAQERDNLAVFDEKIEEVNNKKNNLINTKKK